jgi:hypothetical protein
VTAVADIKKKCIKNEQFQHNKRFAMQKKSEVEYDISESNIKEEKKQKDFVVDSEMQLEYCCGRFRFRFLSWSMFSDLSILIVILFI